MEHGSGAAAKTKVITKVVRKRVGGAVRGRRTVSRERGRRRNVTRGRSTYSSSRGRRRGRGRGRGSRGSTKTAEQLDAELDAYHKKETRNTGSAGQPKAVFTGQPPALND